MKNNFSNFTSAGVIIFFVRHILIYNLQLLFEKHFHFLLLQKKYLDCDIFHYVMLVWFQYFQTSDHIKSKQLLYQNQNQSCVLLCNVFLDFFFEHEGHWKCIFLFCFGDISIPIFFLLFQQSVRGMGMKKI